MTNTTSGTEHQIAAARRWRRHVGAGRELSAFLLIAGFMVVLAAALNAFGVSPRRLTAILFFLTITLSGLFWGPWPAIIAAMGGVLFIDYFLIRSPSAFSVPSLREGILLFGLFAAGLVVGAFSKQMPGARQKVQELIGSGQLQRALVREGTGTALVVVLALALHAFGAPMDRLVVIAPFFLIIGVTAFLLGNRPANVAAIVSLIVVNYFWSAGPTISACRLSEMQPCCLDSSW